MIGRVFAIEEFSTLDGPGIRTTVFLKGCPLRCTWCHNPEGQSFFNQIVTSPNGCISCGACLDVGERLTGTRALVAESIAACPRGLVRECAKDYMADALCDRLLSNAPLLNRGGGGVTFSGGEPLAQYDFLAECLEYIGNRTNRAIQTSGICDGGAFRAILRHVDFVLYDIKIIDDDLHVRYTGASNGPTLANLQTLRESRTPFCVRMPLIPTITDTSSNATAVAVLLESLALDYIELLPYNTMAGAKYHLVSRAYEPRFDAAVSVDPHLEIFAAHGISANVL